MLRKNLIIFIFSCILIGLTNAQDNSIYVNLSFIHSDIHGSQSIREGERLRGSVANSPKTGYLLSFGRIQKVWKGFHIDISINYQERLPLEKFVFSTPDPTPGTNGIVTLANIPTSSQSKMWDSGVYNRLPNFKYTHFELIPSYTFGRRLECSFGLGLFYGRLLNQKKLMFSREDFPQFDFVFQPPFNASNSDSYRKNDIGWIPKIKVTYGINQQLKLGFSSKAYFSEYALKSKPTGLSSWGRNATTTWQVFTFGLDIVYILNPRI